MWRLLKVLILLSMFVGGAHADEHPSLKGKNDVLCDAVRNYSWERFTRLIDGYEISTNAAIKNMSCNFKDMDGNERSNSILYIVASDKEDGIQGIFTWDLITHLEEKSQIDMLVGLIIGTEPHENIFHEIEEAKFIARSNDKVVEELVEMHRALCLTIRKHKLADLKPLYMQWCVK